MTTSFYKKLSLALTLALLVVFIPVYAQDVAQDEIKRVEGEILQMLRKLQSLSFDTAFLDSEQFQALRDNSTILPEGVYGRNNPYLPRSVSSSSFERTGIANERSIFAPVDDGEEVDVEEEVPDAE